MKRPFLRWFEARWDAFRQSYSTEENAAASSPVAIAVACAAQAGAILGIGWVAGVPSVWIALALTGLGGLASYAAHRYACSGAIGTTATLLDGPLYAAGLIYMSVRSSGVSSFVAVGLYAAMVLAIQAPAYSLTALFGAGLAVPAVVLGVLFRPPPTLLIALAGTLLMALLISYQTGERRRLVQAKTRLTQAFSAANQVADESMQAALATTLLSLGDLLHELRNAQTVVGLNLSFLKEEAHLKDEEREALEEALTGQRAEAELVKQTIVTLQRRALAKAEPFRLDTVLAESAGLATKARVHVSAPLGDFRVVGNPDYLRVVLRNLFRNAEQAGSQNVWVEGRVAPGGHSAELSVHDDGSGIPEATREKLFDLFAFTTKPDGSGLGLYLVKRHVELMGGTISVHVGPAGGADFRLVLPRGLSDEETEEELLPAIH